MIFIEVRHMDIMELINWLCERENKDKEMYKMLDEIGLERISTPLRGIIILF